MGDLQLRRDLLRRGMSEDDLRRAVRAGELRPLRPGAYLEQADPRWRDAPARHRALTDATCAQLAPGAVVSHVSAAVRHRLPVWGVPLGTRSRVRMDRLGVARPVLQHRIVDAGGRHVATVDFWWPSHGVVGEFDGLEKLGDAIAREKRREDALRVQPEIRTVVRWTWDEIADFAAVAARLPRP